MKRNASLFLCIVVLMAVSACSKEAPPAAPPPPDVMVAAPIQRDVPVYMELVGQAVGFQDVEIRARVEGFLETVAFTEGSLVRKGQLLYKIDPKPLQAVLRECEGEPGDFPSAAGEGEERRQPLQTLVAQQAVSQQELDNAVSAQEAALAQVDAGRAAVEKAEFDLSYTTITAPLDGLIGTTKVKAGNLVGRGESTLLVTISQIDPILFRAGIAEAEYLKVARRFTEQQAQGVARGAKTPIQLILADGTVHPHEGFLDAVERNVDTLTGTIALQIKFDNPERIVRPRPVRPREVRHRTQAGRPARAAAGRSGAAEPVQRGGGWRRQQSELPHRQGGAARGHPLGDRRRAETGERVVVEGLQRLREGATVNRSRRPRRRSPPKRRPPKRPRRAPRRPER